MSVNDLLAELRDVIRETNDISNRLGDMNKEATTLHGRLALLAEVRARVEVDLITIRPEVV